jgi:alanine-synthesizing transaminase
VFSARTDWPVETNRITQAIERARAGGRNLLDLTVSNPTTAGFKYPQIQLPTAPIYDPQSKGLLTARQAVSRYYRERTDPCAVDPERIFVVPGTSEAYSYIFRLLCGPNDEVLIGAPGYPLLDLLANICDVKLVRFHCFYDHGWHIDFHDVEQRITSRTRAICLVHPNNPTGAYVKPEDRARLDSLCGRHELALVVDEVFLDYNVELAPYPSFADHSEVLTFTLNGVSKLAGLPQMKLSWLTVSGPHTQVAEAVRRLEIISDTFLSASTPIQLAAAELIASRQQFHRQLLDRVRANLAEFDSQIRSRTSACNRLLVEGGWYVTLRVPNVQSDEELALSLIESDGVIVEAGHFFDFPQEGYLVLSLVTPEPMFKDGVRRILARF